MAQRDAKETAKLIATVVVCLLTAGAVVGMFNEESIIAAANRGAHTPPSDSSSCMSVVLDSMDFFSSGRASGVITNNCSVPFSLVAVHMQVTDGNLIVDSPTAYGHDMQPGQQERFSEPTSATSIKQSLRIIRISGFPR